LKALLHKAETAPRGWDNDIHGEPLLGALPQIVAVVEAAELKPMCVYVGIPMEDGRPSGRVRYPLEEALAALDEALA
jgi:hypothetical protein